ncbi:syndecan-2-A-like [Sinocyclocheilus rhinocerous]|uniref:Syndecan n=1 Tax=Sinocyclocheilus rhinocerous TaxID=307959 RepID=A0A673HWQ1_9TELE|nr:PREDICTED: syndecan-2-A-like [Sinocyclocheilus rhinocerous]
MRNIWIFLTLSAAVCLSSDKVLVSGQSPASTDDIYLDDQQSGDYPLDDDDFTSGSGSGSSDTDDDEDTSTVIVRYPEFKADSTQEPVYSSSPSLESSISTDTFIDSDFGPEISDYQTEKPQVTVESTSSPSVVQDADPLHEVRTENLFQRTEVLAAVIAGGVIGFLFAIFLILLLVYRMRKKDEGSYDLGERKPPSSAYQKAPSKEFYA